MKINLIFLTFLFGLKLRMFFFLPQVAKEVKMESYDNICNYELPSVHLSGFKSEKLDLSTLDNNEELYKCMGFVQFQSRMKLERA